MPKLFLTISSGRSGTQWLARSLRETYPDLAVVTHEPIVSRYRGREFYRLDDRVEAMLEVPAIRRHIGYVSQVIEGGRSYVETGSQVYAAIPLFVERFAGGVGLIHLTRHPVPASLSLMTLIDHLSEGDWDGEAWEFLGLPDPACPGSIQRMDEAEWRASSPFRKCLYEWTEKHLYALELEERFPDVPMLRMSSEELFGGGTPALERLVSFLGLPLRSELLQAQGRRVDKAARLRSRLTADWREVTQAPETAEAARRLGFEATDVDVSALRRRSRVRFPSLRRRRRTTPRAALERTFRRLGWRVHDLPSSPGVAMEIAAPLLKTSGLVLDGSRDHHPVLALLLAHGGERRVVVLGRHVSSVGSTVERSVAAGSVVRGVVADPASLPFRAGAFDAAVGDRPEEVSALAEVLRPRGRLVLAVHNRGELGALARRLRGRSPPSSGYTWSEMLRIVQNRFRVRGRATAGWSGCRTARIATRLVRYPPFRRLGRLIILDLEAAS